MAYKETEYKGYGIIRDDLGRLKAYYGLTRNVRFKVADKVYFSTIDEIKKAIDDDEKEGVQHG